MNRKRGFVTVAVVGLVLLALGGLAWACTVAASLSIAQISGPAGVPVNITGSTFGPAPVEIRWNSVDGQILATAQGPDFTVAVTPPADARADFYYVVAIQKGPEAVFKASGIFEVTGPSGAKSQATSTDLWSGFTGQSSSVPAVPQATPDSAFSSSAAGFRLLAAGAMGLIGAGFVAAKGRKTRLSSGRS
ncbi:MAG: hypothetical protein ACRDIU_02200 [Actinomycetota bacterium]